MATVRLRHNAGFTLLEIILALTILAGALAALGEIVRLGDRSAVRARESTKGQLLAASLLDEMLSGARALAAAQGTEEVAPNEFWQYRIEVDPAPHDELAVLRVVVSQDLPEQLEPASFALLRWIPNPSTAATSGDEASSSSSSFDDGVRSE